MEEAPRKILMQEVPVIALGRKTNIIIADIREKFKIQAGEFYSKGRNCPFEGWEVSGRVEATFLGDRWWLRPGRESMVRRAG